LSCAGRFLPGATDKVSLEKPLDRAPCFGHPLHIVPSAALNHPQQSLTTDHPFVWQRCDQHLAGLRYAVV